MSKAFPMVPLGEVLIESEERADIDPGAYYRQVTVRLWGKGVALRGEIAGSDIAASKQFLVRTNQFILSKIDARNGAFGLIPASLDSALVSSDFPVFTLNKSRIIPEFLHWMSKTRNFIGLCKAASEGTTNRVRLKIGRFLATKIPLPPLEEQQRIVARIEELAGKIEEARGLHQQLLADYDNLCRSFIFDKANNDFVYTPMKELVRLREPDVFTEPEERYHFAGVYCFGKGMFRGQIRSGTEFAYDRLTRLQAGNFVYPKLMAWEGALAIVPPECEGLVVSPEFPVFELNQEHVLPETLDIYFRTPLVWPILSGVSTGTNVRRRRLNPSDFLAFEFPLPSMQQQQQLRRVKMKVDTLKRKQSEASAELDAMLPSILDKAFKGEL
jgi:type I restriction enzyme S subunit